jgi:hypothetical protein
MYLKGDSMPETKTAEIVKGMRKSDRTTLYN